MSSRPGPEWKTWPELEQPGEVTFTLNNRGLGITHCYDVNINGRRVGWLERRPHYCDRGRWKFCCDLPYIERSTDGFPRYYMDETRAKLEIIAWLNWRLWEKSVS